MEAAPNCKFPEEFGPRERPIPAASDVQVNEFIDGWVGLGWIGRPDILLFIILDQIDRSDLTTVGMAIKFFVFLLNRDSKLYRGCKRLWRKGPGSQSAPENLLVIKL